MAESSRDALRQIEELAPSASELGDTTSSQ
jgi:hypothetical protein